MSLDAIISVLNNKDTTGMERFALLMLADSANVDGFVHVRINDLASKLNVKKNYATKLITQLVALGHLVPANPLYKITCFTPRHIEEKRQTHYNRARDAASRHTANSNVKLRILKRDGYQCQECGTGQELTIDHIIPVAKGGGNEDTNLQVLCKSCNSKKGAK